MCGLIYRSTQFRFRYFLILLLSIDSSDLSEIRFPQSNRRDVTPSQPLRLPATGPEIHGLRMTFLAESQSTENPRTVDDRKVADDTIG